VRHIAHFVSLTEPYAVGEVVLHDAEVIPVVLDVGREIRTIPPANDLLLAPVRRLPIDFEHELIGLDQPRRFPQAFGQLSEEEDESMRADTKITKGCIGLTHRALRDSTSDDRLRCIGTPLLGPKQRRRGNHKARANDNAARHASAISARLVAAATAVAAMLAGCSDLGPPADTTLRGADLLPVGLSGEAPAAASTSVWIPNARTTTVRLVHPDGFNSPYVEVEFPSGTLESLNGVPLTAADSVLVSLTPEVDGYGLTLSPAGLELAPGAVLTARFVLAAYGDLSVADGSDTYASRTAYAEALALWREIGIDLWERISGSRFTAGDIVTGKIAGPGRYRVAAPR
jgi:hypothetical protein